MRRQQVRCLSLLFGAVSFAPFFRRPRTVNGKTLSLRLIGHLLAIHVAAGRVLCFIHCKLVLFVGFLFILFFFLYFIRRQSQENPTTFFSAHFQCESSLHSSGTPADGHMVFVRHQRPTNSQLSSRLEQVRTSLLLEFIFESLYKSFVRVV